MIEEVTQHQALASTHMRTCTHVHTHACLHHTRNESNEKQMFHHPRVFFMAHISSCFVILKTLSGKRQLACDKKRNCWETELASTFLGARTAAKHRWVARRWHSCVPAQFLTPRVAVSWGLRAQAASGERRQEAVTDASRPATRLEWPP